MSTKTQIRIAKEIKTNFLLIILSILIALVTYGVLYATLKPPVNPPIPKEIKERIREQSRAGAPFVQVGLALKTHSKYDAGMPFSYILDDRINEWRERQFKADIYEKTHMVFFAILILLVGGRYVIQIVIWVNKTSKQG